MDLPSLKKLPPSSDCGAARWRVKRNGPRFMSAKSFSRCNVDLIEDDDEDENDPRCPGFVKQKPVYRFCRI